MNVPAKTRPWLQYSLRGLLIAMLVIGLGLVAFRWPWVEREVFTDPLGYSETQTRTFRRDWNGRPLRHGLQKFGPFEEFYVDDVKTWEARYTNDGQLKLKRHFHGDQLHGPYFDLTLGTEGEFRLGKKQGRWQIKQLHDRETVICEQWFDNGRADGLWIWKSGEQVVQTAQFQAGKLAEWNGQPVADELARVLAVKNVDAVTRAALGASVAQVDFDHWSCHGGAAFEWPLKNSPHRLLMQVPMCNDLCLQGTVQKHLPHPQQGVCEAFLEQALLASRTLDYRFGVICFVPIAQSEIAWQDRSGVSQIHFTPGSPEEMAWLELVKSGEGLPADESGHLQELFEGTPIQIEVATQRLPPSRMASAVVNRDPPIVLRSRRDVLGMFLVSRGWTCQQRGNKLEILPSAKAS